MLFRSLVVGQRHEAALLGPVDRVCFQRRLGDPLKQCACIVGHGSHLPTHRGFVSGCMAVDDRRGGGLAAREVLPRFGFGVSEPVRGLDHARDVARMAGRPDRHRGDVITSLSVSSFADVLSARRGVFGGLRCIGLMRRTGAGCDRGVAG